MLFGAANTYGQCNNVTLNWDYLDFLIYTGNYTSGGGFLASNAWSQTQNYAFGTNRLTITHNFADGASLGENGGHTGEAGSYGTGDDIAFNGNGTITFTFETEVQNFKISLYDLDNSNTATVTAKNAANVAQNVVVTKSNGLSTITFNPLGGSGTSVVATGTALATAANATTATINIDVAGPVKSVTIVVNGGDFWLSDITACSPGSFPNNYYAISRPFTGQPGYVLHALDEAVYAVNPANGFTKLLFTDPTDLGCPPSGGVTCTSINSMAYDPYKRILYYVYSLTANAPGNKKLMKYDFNTGAISTVIADLTTIGVPVTTNSGVESGAASFYNGSLYLGVEATNGSKNANRESIVWRIDFDASNNPYRASQVWAMPSDDGAGKLMHDWGDFVINDGILYDFDGASANRTTAPLPDLDVYNTNLMTGATTNWTSPTWIPGQPAVDWNGQVYNLHAITSAPSNAPYIATYNPATGTLGTKFTMTSTPMYTPAIPSVGDAAEAFRPLCDFGDAPATYDPVALSPAVHEIDPKLHLGASEDIEWTSKGQTALANSDNFDDGLPYVTTFSPYSAAYLIQVTVFNNTGSPATLGGWLDYNGNGVFDAGEGKTVSVPSSAANQLVYLYWPLISSSLTNGTYTYLRLRVTSAANGMTTANPTGYFVNGETEDYRVPVNNYVLATQLLSFNAMKNGNMVNVEWKTSGEQPGTKYDVERSLNMIDWSSLNVTTGSGTGGSYAYSDNNPLNGTSYYRLKTNNPDGSVSYSKISTVIFNNVLSFTLAPNPAHGQVKMIINGDGAKMASIKILDIMGRSVYQQSVTIDAGPKSIILPTDRLGDGIYSVQLQVDNKQYIQKLVIKK
jgi:hypothetical protein